MSGAILLFSQVNESTRGAYQFLIDAAIILYFIPFLYMFAGVIKLSRRKDRTENQHAVLIPGGIPGVWFAGILGILVVLVGIFVSLVPPGESSDKLGFETKARRGNFGFYPAWIGVVLAWCPVQKAAVRLVSFGAWRMQIPFERTRAAHPAL